MISSRNSNTAFLLLAFVLLLVQPIVAATVTPANNSKWYLLASNGDKKKYYAVSKYVTLFVNNRTIKGKIVAIKEDSITVMSRKKVNSTVAISDIDAVQKNNRSIRVGWIPILSALIVLAIGGILTTGVVAAVFLIMPAIGLFTIIPFWLFCLITEPLSKKSTKNGWVFSAVNK